MNTRKKLLLLTGLCTAFLLGYGGMALAYPAAGIYGRAEYRGYFLNGNDTSGTYVLPQGCTGCNSGEAIRASVAGNVDDFINFIKFTNLDIDGNGTTVQRRTGAQFIIQTMRGGVSHAKPAAVATDPSLVAWEEDVRYAASRGWITWRTNFSYTLNSYYQGGSGGTTPADDAFYDDSGTFPAIVFRDGTGKIVYVLKWACANPIGTSTQGNGGLPPAPPNFTMSGQVVPDRPTAYAGETVDFTYSLTNTGPEATSPMAINWTAEERQGGSTISTKGSGNAGTFTNGQNKTVFTENDYPIPLSAVPGSLICRRISFNPHTGSGGGSASPDACVTVLANYNLNPTVNFEIHDANGALKPDSASGIAEPTDTIIFKYKVNNSTGSTSAAVSCRIYSTTKDGYYARPTPPAYDATAPGASCLSTFPSGDTNLADESVATTTLFNKTICRSLEINPASPGAGAKGDQKCVVVANKPYARTYGGDVSAGGGLATIEAPTTCTTNSGAAVIGWNKRTAGYPGAGVQYAIYALNAIFDTASASMSGSGSASPPTGLSFANTSTNAANGQFGGNLNTVACMADHYAGRPGTLSPIPATVSNMSDGSYGGTGNVQIGGGTVNPNNQISVYVDGNVFISGNITYGGSGSWTADSIPMFRLVVTNGNIFIDNDVSQLDGLYVAQPSGGTGGIIYTCAQQAAPFTPMVLGAVLASQCDNTKLTVNGGFVAKQLQLLRTIGTQARSGAAEAASSANIAEVFNYNPMLWISQPVNTSGSTEYDAINSLPPIL